jgi:hypothetical protein
MKKTRKKRHTLLLGEGIHQHTLYGDFAISQKEVFADVEVLETSLLKHEKPNRTFGEHETLEVKKGKYVMGKQVEYNPFNKKVERVWD